MTTSRKTIQRPFQRPTIILAISAISIAAAILTVSACNREKSTQPGPIFSLRPFIVNLADKQTRFLKASIALELEEKKAANHLEKALPRIRHTILILLTSKCYNDIKDHTGKKLLRQQIIHQINNCLGPGKIRQVYFTEFIIQ
jgi:flagellar FliL protein